jgi:hypothetical protein
MKTTNKTLIAALAGIVLFSFASPVQAQYNAVGDDGICASPKVRQRLTEIKSRAEAESLKPGDAIAIAADQSKDMFLDVRQIVFLKKGEPQKNQIVINDPGKIKQLVDLLHLVKSERLVCDMAWQVTFIKKTGSVETFVCKGCIEIHDKNGSERFQTPPEFYKLVQHIAE